MAFSFTTPWALAALLILPLVVWIERRSWNEHLPWRRRSVLACRILEVVLLVLAVAGFRLERKNEQVSVLFAVDTSRSISDEAKKDALAKINAAADAMRADDQAGVITFGREPFVESIPKGRLKIESIQSQPNADFTDISATLRLAAGVFPEGTRRRLVLFSDGNENRGHALESLRAIQAAGIEIDVFPIEMPHRNEVSITRLDVPSRVEKDAPFDLKVEAEATEASPATLRFFRDGATLGRKEVELQPGRNQFSVAFNEDKPGFHTYEAVIESAADAQPENNIGGAFTLVSGPSRVLIVGRDEDTAALANALDLSKLAHDTLAELPASLAALQPYDAIFLDNVPATDFSPAQLEGLERYVRDLGGGLGMIGGENSFGPGGWIGTAVERALPVDMELKTKERFPSLSLVMVIDKSGSMGGSSGGASKMELASRAAVEAVDLLGPRDQVGVVAFDSAAKWVSHLGPASNKGEITRDVRSMVPGGGTDAYQGLLMAYDALTAADTKLKHVIMLTDGQTPAAGFDELLGKMNVAGITVSTIAVGTDADQAFLEALARNGRGRYYYCPDPQRVPRIFVRETILVQRSYLMEETASPSQGAVHPILADAALGAMPPLHGWVVTEPKMRAEPVLRIKSDPLLAVWQYGLGKSVAFTSDAKARWARDWTGWEGYASFWDRVVRWSLRGVASTELHPQVKLDRGAGKISVDAASADGERLNLLNLKARVIRPDLKVDEIPLRQTAVGTYEADFDADAPGAYLAGVFDDQGRQASAGGMVSFSPEFKDFQSNDYLLYELAKRTGGKVNPTVDEIFRREGKPARTAREVTGPLLIAALVLLLVEVALRRLYFDEEQIAAARALVRRLTPLRFASAGGPGIGAEGVASDLKTRSRRVKSRLRKAAPEPPAPEAAIGTAPTLATGSDVSAQRAEAATEPTAEETLSGLKRRQREKTSQRERPEPVLPLDVPSASAPIESNESNRAGTASSQPTESPHSPSRPPDQPIPPPPAGEWSNVDAENVSKLLDRKRKRKGGPENPQP